MTPEKEDGNVEYKLKLINKTEDRIETLATQMRYRCIEGGGECIYNLGVKDDGTTEGITKDEYNETINNIKLIAEKNNYTVTVLTETDVKADKKIYELLIREKNENKYIDIKVAVAGNVDAGKSTIISCLITGKNDNGRGLVRGHIFNYIHELKTGRTSSISHQILGYDYDGKIVNYQGVNKLSWGEIVQKSSKIISFFDLAGHEKYLKTTILGLASSFPDICMIIVDANNGIKPMTKEHIFLCVTLKIPFIIVITKIDICKDRKNILKETTDGINKFLKYPGIRKIPFHIKNKDDVVLCAKNIYNDSITPIFSVSCVNLEGLDTLKTFLNILSKKTITKLDDDIVEFHIDHVFNVNGFGIVAGGHLISGKVTVGDKLLIGPHSGMYENVIIRSIYCKKTALQSVNCGSYVCLGIKKCDKMNIKRGNVIISNKNNKPIVKKFTAEINILRTHSTSVKVGYEPMCNTYSIRQVTKILNIKEKKDARFGEKDDKNIDNVLRNGDTAIVDLEFKYHPEYLKVGTRFILSESRCKIAGEVLSII